MEPRTSYQVRFNLFPVIYGFSVNRFGVKGIYAVRARRAGHLSNSVQGRNGLVHNYVYTTFPCIPYEDEYGRPINSVRMLVMVKPVLPGEEYLGNYDVQGTVLEPKPVDEVSPAEWFE
jgi:hypothetical protein